MHVMLVGCGHMGLALAQGWLDESKGPYISKLDVIDVDEEKVRPLLKDPRVMWWDRVPYQSPHVLLFALKPDILLDTIKFYRDVVDQDKTCVMSVAAGIPIQEYEKNFPHTPIIRLMPNTPSVVHQGMTLMLANNDCKPENCQWAEDLMGSVGKTMWLSSDDDMDKGTALSGSGPAYVFRFVEALTQGGIALGLSPETSSALARQIIIGAGAYLNASKKDVSKLREEVTSPGGTTAAGLKRMDHGLLFDRIIQDTLKDAYGRAREISRQTP
jgi:pyrroline-5-carboxylate reductase